MPASFDEWSDQHWDRTFARQTAQIDNVKLLVTFALGISATVTATALQVDPSNRLDLAACLVLAVGFILTIAVIALDSLKWPSRARALRKRTRYGWTEAQLMAYITDISEEFEDRNDKIVRRVRRFAEYQLILATCAATLAAISLFQPAT